MKIENKGNISPVKAIDQGQTSNLHAKSASISVVRGDVVTISKSTRQLKSSAHLEEDEEVFDSKKVNKLKHAIAKGELTVDSRKVAKEIIETTVALIKK